MLSSHSWTVSCDSSTCMSCRGNWKKSQISNAAHVRLLTSTGESVVLTGCNVRNRCETCSCCTEAVTHRCQLVGPAVLTICVCWTVDASSSKGIAWACLLNYWTAASLHIADLRPWPTCAKRRVFVSRCCVLVNVRRLCRSSYLLSARVP